MESLSECPCADFESEGSGLKPTLWHRHVVQVDLDFLHGKEGPMRLVHEIYQKKVLAYLAILPYMTCIWDDLGCFFLFFSKMGLFCALSVVWKMLLPSNGLKASSLTYTRKKYVTDN